MARLFFPHESVFACSGWQFGLPFALVFLCVFLSWSGCRPDLLRDFIAALWRRLVRAGGLAGAGLFLLRVWQPTSAQWLPEPVLGFIGFI